MEFLWILKIKEVLFCTFVSKKAFCKWFFWNNNDQGSHEGSVAPRTLYKCDKRKRFDSSSFGYWGSFNFHPFGLTSAKTLGYCQTPYFIWSERKYYQLPERIFTSVAEKNGIPFRRFAHFQKGDESLLPTSPFIKTGGRRKLSPQKAISQGDCDLVRTFLTLSTSWVNSCSFGSSPLSLGTSVN